MDRRKISDRWELKRKGLNRRMLLPCVTITIAFSTMKVFSDEDCSDSDTDNIPTLLHYAPVENSLQCPRKISKVSNRWTEGK